MVCPLRRERFVHLSRKRLFESDRSSEERKREGDQHNSHARSQRRRDGQAELEEDEEKRRWKAEKMRGRGEISAGYYVNCLGTLCSKRVEVPHARLALGNAVRRASRFMKKLSMKGAIPAIRAHVTRKRRAILFSRELSFSFSLTCSVYLDTHRNCETTAMPVQCGAGPLHGPTLVTHNNAHFFLTDSDINIRW